jgi:uncharacterized glyoxalase superfamily protein PhnB
MTKATSWIRAGLHTITPRLIFKNAQKAIEFYETAFGAQRRKVALTPDGQKVLHGEIQIGNSVIFIVDEVPQAGCISPESTGAPGASLALSVENVDACFRQAVDAGCNVKTPVADMFWGDRWGVVMDPFGNTWEISTHIEDLTDAEMQQRVAEACSQMAKAR